MAEHMVPRDAHMAETSQYRYRANPRLGELACSLLWVVPVILMGGFIGPNWYWAILWGLVCLGFAFAAERLLVRRVTLSPDLRMSVRGLGQDLEVDVRQLKEIRLSRLARVLGGSARVRWEGGSFRLWSTVSYVSGPADRTGLRPGRRWSGEGLNDLVYRLRLANPQLVVRGVRPPSWAWRVPQQPPPY